MTIQEQLLADQKTAMRGKDKPTLNAIRSIQSEVAAAKSAPGFDGDVDDALYLKTIATYVKRISKSRDEYVSMGGPGEEHAGKLAFEIDYLSAFLPRKLDEAATKELVDKAITDLGADANTPIGKVIGAVMRSGQDVDGALVNKLVRELISD